MRAIYDELARIHAEGGAAAVCTVIGTQGSTPGKATMKLLIKANGTGIGSVGGGCVEAEVFSRAKDVMATERSQRFSVDLNEHDNPETGLVCGGRIELFIEPVVVPNVYVFGAGHVARALVEAAQPAGFRFTVIDDRAEYATTERFPKAAAVQAQPWEAAIAALSIDADAFVAIMTRGHKDDLAVLRALAAHAVTPRYLGMIGSKSKWITLAKALRDEGVGEEFLKRVKTPIGLDIGARSAEEIAISIAAEFVAMRRVAPAGGVGGDGLDR